MTETLLLTAGTLVAAVISGASGFGFSLVGTALWSHFLEPQLVAVLAVVFSMVLNVAYLPLFWRDIQLRRLAPFAAGSMVGVPCGVWALHTVRADNLRLGLGTLLAVYGGWMLSRVKLPVLKLSPRAGIAGDVVIGTLGGFFGGLSGLSGFLPALWCVLRGWDKSANRGLVQAYILFTGLLSMAWLGKVVGVDARAGHHLLIGLPFLAVGAFLGLKVFSRFDTAAFNRAVLWLVAVCGVLIVIGR